ncbi:MAG: DUF2085 domain-containing protein [Methanomicrobiales archaeon]
MPERTFKLGSYYFPVCSRCTGIYTGSLTYYAFVYFIYVNYTWDIVTMGVILILPTLWDGITQLKDLRISNNNLRFTSGLMAGIGMGILVKAIKFLIIYN